MHIEENTLETYKIILTTEYGYSESSIKDLVNRHFSSLNQDYRDQMISQIEDEISMYIAGEEEFLAQQLEYFPPIKILKRMEEEF